MTSHPRHEIELKVERVAALAREVGLAGIIVSTQHNFAWLTAGRTNRIDASREVGTASLLVAADGRRFALASAIESPRVVSETVEGLGFELIDYPWTDERADPALPIRLAARKLNGGIGADTPSAGAEFLEPRIARLRAPLVEEEIVRMRHLGRDVGEVLGRVLRGVAPGVTETDVARTVAMALLPIDARPVVLLVAADDRIARYRHPTPTALRWKQRLLVAVCAERQGLVVALSRLASTGPIDREFARRTHATAHVFAALLEAMTPGASAARLFDAAAGAYAAAGFPAEERLHHQGGAIGYRAREWVAHPRSEDIVTPPQAFAWNPSVTGTKIEETCLVHADGRIEMLTSSPEWPTITVQVRGATLPLPDVLVLQS